jgi:hypothetical protein
VGGGREGGRVGVCGGYGTGDVETTRHGDGDAVHGDGGCDDAIVLPGGTGTARAVIVVVFDVVSDIVVVPPRGHREGGG